MANPTMTLIASNTVGSGGVSSVTFSSIPSTYTDLKVVMSLRTNSAANYDNFTMSINSSTTSFTFIQIYGSGSAASSYAYTGGIIADIDAANNTVSTFSNLDIYIPNYTAANNKSYSVDSVQENNATLAYAEMLAGLWSNTSAITSLTFTSNNGSFVQYSTFYLYGISNS